MITLLWCVSVLFSTAPLVFAAEQQIVKHDDVVSCYKQMTASYDAVNCVGNAANTCQEIHDADFDGGSTRGISLCLEAETKIWDAYLNSNYKVLMAQAAEQEKQSLINDLDRTDALRDAQRAWIAFRDAECARLYAESQSGTIRSLVWGSCMLQLTSQRALALDYNSGY